MRKKILFPVLFIALAFTCIVFLSRTDSRLMLAKFSDDSGEQEMPKKAMEWEYYRRVNPLTGEIPPDAYWNAYQELKRRGFIQTSVRSSSVDTNGWQPIDNFFPSLSVTRIVYDPNNTQTFYFCTGEGWYNIDAVRGAGVWKSTDGGQTWNQLSSTNNLFQDYVSLL